MAATPQSNTTLEFMAAALGRHESFLVCGHVNPDGDCLGSQLVLAEALRAQGKAVTCLLAADAPLDAGLASLAGDEVFVPAASYDGPVDAFVCVDVPTPERMGEAAAALHARAAETFTLDHHAVPERVSDVSYTDPAAASTTLLAWELAGCMGVDPTPRMAQCAYTGLMTDSGCFKNQNADERAFRGAADMVRCGADPSAAAVALFQQRTLASLKLQALVIGRLVVDEGCGVAVGYASLDDFRACGAERADAEGLVDVIRSLAGMRAVAMLREQEDGVRGSLRAKGDVDVASVARALGGGGHRAAAGVTLRMPLADAVETVRAALAEALDRPASKEA